MTWAINVPGVKNLTQGQVDAVIAAAKTLNIDPDWLFTVISFETGGSFSPTVRNAAGSGAFGLIQFMPSTAQALLKTSTRDEAVQKGLAMSFSEQLNKMVVPYLKGAPLKSLEDVYLKIFYPAAMNKPNDYVVGRFSDGGFSAKVYTQNKGFDREQKGYITRADITRKIRSIYDKGHGLVEVTAPDVEVVTAPKGGLGQFLVGVLLALGLSYSAYTRTDLLQGSIKIRETPRPLPPGFKAKLPAAIRRVV
jgi:hypothetical protein